MAQGKIVMMRVGALLCAVSASLPAFTDAGAAVFGGRFWPGTRGNIRADLVEGRPTLT